MKKPIVQFIFANDAGEFDVTKATEVFANVVPRVGEYIWDWSVGLKTDGFISA